MPRRYRIRIVATSVVLWVLVRGVLMGGGVLVPTPIVSLAVLMVVFAIVRLDMRIMREDIFLANLGVRRWAIRVTSILPAFLLETTAAVMGRVLGW